MMILKKVWGKITVFILKITWQVKNSIGRLRWFVLCSVFNDWNCLCDFSNLKSSNEGSLVDKKNGITRWQGKVNMKIALILLKEKHGSH